MAAILPMSDPHADLRRRLSVLITQGLSTATIADLAGVSRPSVSRFLNEPQFGSPTLVRKLTNAVERLERNEEGASNVEVTEGGFVMTQDAQQVLGVCELARKNRRLAVVVAPPGAGKSMTVELYRTRVPETVYVRANPNMSAAGLCIRIGQQLGLDLRNGQSLDYMVDSIVARLRDEPRLLIIDEADYLTSKVSLRRMELLRTIHDEARCGMVLVGMPRLMTALTSGLNMRENLAQFYSRVAYLVRLNGWSDDEIRAFARDYELEPDAWALLFRLARDQERGGMRRVGNLLANASFLADGGKISLRHLREAAEEMELMKG